MDTQADSGGDDVFDKIMALFESVSRMLKLLFARNGRFALLRGYTFSGCGCQELGGLFAIEIARACQDE